MTVYKAKETKDPVLEHVECHRERVECRREQVDLSKLGTYGEWRDWFKEDTMKANPLDPHHVLLDIIKDLHSTNLTRQNQILELRDQVRKEIANAAGYTDLKRARIDILGWIIRWRDSKPKKKGEWVQLIDQIYNALEHQ